MRFSINTTAIAFSTKNKQLDSAIKSSVIGITQEIYQDYCKAAEEDGTGFFKEFLEWLIQDSENFFSIKPEALNKFIANPEKLNPYIVAAYINGNTFIAGEENQNINAEANNFGVAIEKAETFEHKKKRNKGVNILDVIDLNENTNLSHSTIHRYFAQERRVIIYDKFIKNSSLELIESICQKMDPSGEIIIISDFSAGVTAEQCMKACRKHIKNTKAYTPNFRDRSNGHDRHIHIGNRLHLTFSSGTDCFGLQPEFKNSECQITIYQVSEHYELKKYPVKNITTRASSIINTASKKI